MAWGISAGLGRGWGQAKTISIFHTTDLDGHILPTQSYRGMMNVGGFRIALVGLVTPGLPYGLSPDTLAGVSPTDPVESLKHSLAEARSAKADAIVLMCHMGWRKEDDVANPLNGILKSHEVSRVLHARRDMRVAHPKSSQKSVPPS